MLIYQRHHGQEVIPLIIKSLSVLGSCIQLCELTQYPALESFLDRRRRNTKMMVSAIIAAQVPMIRPRWSAWRSKPGLPIGGTSISVIALEVRLLSPAGRHERACARKERADAGRYRNTNAKSTVQKRKRKEKDVAHVVFSRCYAVNSAGRVLKCIGYVAAHTLHFHDVGPCLDPEMTGSSGAFWPDWLSLMLRLCSGDC